MRKIPNSVFNQFEQVARRVLTDLKSRGHVIPVRQPNGSIQYEKFIVSKNANGLYSVSSRHIVYFDNLNLPQTAAIVANDLALGKIVDSMLINVDRDYGFKLFEEEVYTQASKRKKNTLDQVIFYSTRRQNARVQKQELKDRIMKTFKKLTNII